MGEVIKNLTTIKLGGGEFLVELNHPSGSAADREIHIQNESFRLSLSEREFLQMAACVMLAKKQLDIIKYKKPEPSSN